MSRKRKMRRAQMRLPQGTKSDEEDISLQSALLDDEAPPQVAVEVDPFDFSKFASKLRPPQIALEDEDDERAQQKEDVKISSFVDLFSFFSVGIDGVHVTVERKAPKQHNGTIIQGMQRSVLNPLTYAEFVELYGSGTYLLTVCGPTKNNRRGTDGSLLMKAYSKPFRLDIPNPFGDHPPRIEMASVLDEEENMQVRKIAVTEPEADIEKAKLDHDLRKTQEDRDWELRQEERKERKERANESAFVEMMRLQSQSSNKDVQTLMAVLSANKPEAELRSAQAEIGRLQQEIARKVSEHSAALSVANQAHLSEISHLRDSNAKEIANVRDMHARDLESIRREIDSRRQEANERAVVERRDLQERHDRETKNLRETFDRERSDLKERIRDSVESERRSQELLRVSDSTANSFQVTALKAQHEAQSQMLMAEIRRLQESITRLENELAEEKRKTLGERISEASELAEALGYTKDEGGREEGGDDLKGALAKTAVTLLAQAPDIINALKSGGAVAAAPQLPANRPYIPPPPMYQAQPYSFASEGFEPSADDELRPSPPIPTQQMAVHHPQHPVHHPQHPAQTPQVQPTPPQPTSQIPGLNISEDQIRSFSGEIRTAFEEGKEEEEYVDELIGQVGKPMLSSILSAVPVESVFSSLKKGENTDSDPLLSIGGQEWLKGVWRIAMKKVST